MSALREAAECRCWPVQLLCPVNHFCVDAQVLVVEPDLPRIDDLDPELLLTEPVRVTAQSQNVAEVAVEPDQTAPNLVVKSPMPRGGDSQCGISFPKRNVGWPPAMSESSGSTLGRSTLDRKIAAFVISQMIQSSAAEDHGEPCRSSRDGRTRRRAVAAPNDLHPQSQSLRPDLAE